ncbi:MAG: restriction endonuclease [Sphingomonadaceae bacterium]|nr:restriction endonuclease [Sphingomonadaceae bacterium]
MSLKNSPTDLHILIQQALAELGSTADPTAIASLVQRLNFGLPAEDEFCVICAWLGRCRLLHKLDQVQVPRSSVEVFQVPDLLAMFDSFSPVLIEVKSKANKKLSFTPEYYAKLIRYADSMKMPLLVAWKHHSIWTLFDIRHLKLARTNFNIDFNEAMRQNLLGILVGDVSYKISAGAGVHLVFAKERLISTEHAANDAYTETWEMRVSEVAFTTGGGQPAKLTAETSQLLATWDMAESEEHTETSIKKSFYANGDGMEFGHRALVHLLDWEGKERDAGGWRDLMRKSEITRSISDFNAALQRAMAEGVVSHVFNQVPVDVPDFLSESQIG